MKPQQFLYCIIIIIVFFSACKEKIVDVTGITLDKETLELVPGEKEFLIATVCPSNADNKNVIWESSNTAVVTVNSDGLVTAVKDGNATITATTQDGNKTATCAITVKESEFCALTYDPPVVISTCAGSAFLEYSNNFLIDINRDGIDDVIIWTLNSSPYFNAYLYFKSCNDECFISTKESFHSVGSLGDTIDEKLNWEDTQFMFPHQNEQQYLPVKLLQNNSIHYGWILANTKKCRMPNSVSEQSYYIIEQYVYCKTANKVITAGQVK